MRSWLPCSGMDSTSLDAPSPSTARRWESQAAASGETGRSAQRPRIPTDSSDLHPLPLAKIHVKSQRLGCGPSIQFRWFAMFHCQPVVASIQSLFATLDRRDRCPVGTRNWNQLRSALKGKDRGKIRNQLCDLPALLRCPTAGFFYA